VGSIPTAAGHDAFALPAVQAHVLFDAPTVQAQSVFVVSPLSTVNTIEHELSVAESQAVPALSNVANGHSNEVPDIHFQVFPKEPVVHVQLYK